jgi:hypothetical protein
MRRATSKRLCCLLLTFCFLLGLVPPIAARAAQTTPAIPADMYDARVAQAWMALLYERVDVIGIYPPTSGRIYAYAGVALYEAVAAGTPTLTSLAGRLNAMPAMPKPDAKQLYDWPSVVNGALAAVSEPLLSQSSVRTLFNATQQENAGRPVRRLREQLAAERRQRVDGEMVTRSLAFGAAIGAAVATWAATDGFSETRNLSYRVPTGDPALWTPTRLGLEPVEPYWQRVRPLVLTDSHECTVPLTLRFSTAIDSAMYAQALEVYQMGIKLTPEEAEIAEFWADHAGNGGMHTGHWLLIGNQLIDQLNLNLAEAAKLLMLIGLAMHETGVSVWTMKYETMVMRPETYIQRYIDPHWEPLLETPNFPEYPSGHATFGAAAAEIITAHWGVIAFTDHAGMVDNMGRSRFFTSLAAAAYENALSRLYGGVHYRMGMEAGLRQGECIGQRILERVAPPTAGSGS